MTTPGPSNLPRPGDVLLGKFRIDRVIGQGGAGVVFAAHHELLDQPIALKLLLAEAGSETAQRFVNEAKLAAKIHSEHVCRVMDVGMLESGLPYIAMEYLEGQDLDAVIEVGPVPLARACDYVMQAMEAVAQAHAQGIIHRDLKPSNLFLAALPAREMPIVKVLDFGISKGEMLGGDTDVTSSRAILGSPSYMSPEQIKNARTVDTRTDIWALGVILYELTTGFPPFGGETVGEVFAKILEGEPVSLQSRAPQLPDGFAAIVMKCLRRDREQRYSSVGQLADALAPYASQSAPELLTSIHGAVSPLLLAEARGEDTRSPGSKTRPGEPPRRKSRVGWLLLISAFGLGGGSVWFLGRAPNLVQNVETLASSASSAIVDSGAVSAAAAAFGGASDVDAALDARGGDSGAFGDSGDAGDDASLDASDDAEAGIDDDDDDNDASTLTAAGVRVAPPHPKGAKPPPKKKPGTKRRPRK